MGQQCCRPAALEDKNVDATPPFPSSAAPAPGYRVTAQPPLRVLGEEDCSEDDEFWDAGSVVSFYTVMEMPFFEGDFGFDDDELEGFEGPNRFGQEFGDEILREDGELDRKKLGSIVFSSKEKIQKLNSIVHPFVRERMMEEIERAISMEKDILLDIPLLFENGIHQWFRPVILVYAPLEVQIERLMKRDGLSRGECEKRIRAQMSIEEKKKLADYIIDNSSDISKTKRQVEEVYDKIYR